jgi:hypothetical protein
MSDAEAALWRAAAEMPALGSGPVSLPGAAVVPFAGSPVAPALTGRASAPAVGSAAPAPRRRGGGGAPSPAGPPPEEDIDATLIAELTNRPEGDPSLFGAYDNREESALDRQLRLNDEGARLAQRRAELMAMGAAEERDAAEGAMAARAEMEAQRRVATMAARDSYRRANDRAASLRVDPDGFYHSRGVGGTIASTIAIGLGAFGSAINGGPNVALQMISEEIDRDIQAQQQAIDSAFRRADAEGTLYDMARQEFNDRGAALDAARALALENVAAQVAESEASLGSAEARHAATVMAEQLRADAASSRAEAERAEIEWQLRMGLLEARARERAAAATRAENRLGAGPSAPSYEEPTEARLNAANRLIDSGNTPDAAAAAVGIDPRLIGGATRFAEATTADSAGNVAALSAALDEIEGLIPSRASGGDAPGVGMTGPLPEWLLTDEGRQMREAIADTVDLLGRLRSGAAISAAEEDRFLRILQGAGTDEGLRRGVARIRDEIRARTSRTREGRDLDGVEADALAGLGGRVVED